MNRRAVAIRPRRPRAWLAAVAAAALVAGCQNPYEAKVDGVLLADAEQVLPVPKEATALVKLTLDQLEPEIPDAPAARLVIARDVTWARVQKTLARFEARGVEPVILVGRDRDVRAFHLPGPIEGPSIHLTATPDGKFCVGPPTTDEALCVTNFDRKHINGAYVRETVRDAVTAYGLTRVDVLLSPDLEWTDVVRTIDRARTCCKGVAVEVGFTPASG